MARGKTKTENILESMLSFTERRNEIEKRYKNDLEKLDNAITSAKNGLNSARTHAIMEGLPYVAKALDVSELINITHKTFEENEELRKKYSNCKDFKEVFQDFAIAMKATGDYLFNHPDIAEEIKLYINLEIEENGRKASTTDDTEPTD